MRWMPLVIALAVLGCAGGAPALSTGSTDGAAASPQLEVGTGTDRFVALENGDSVTLIHGPQGGYHLWGALEASGFAPGDLTVTYSVSLDPEDVLSSSTWVVTPVPDGDREIYAGLRGFVPDPTRAVGQTVTLTMTVTDSQGVSATDARQVVVLPPVD